MPCPTSSSGYVGRFAPSPTGDLHFGSLVAAVGSFLQARKLNGKWLLRVEDIDPPREVPGSAGRIVEDLERLGMRPDEPVLYQATRLDAYADACQALLLTGRAYYCGCSRKQLPSSGIYPGTCRSLDPSDASGMSIRVKVGNRRVILRDRVMGELNQGLESEVGDFVIRRRDGLPAYQLAVVLDDAFQGITEVVRGADLLDSTPRQIFLQETLGLPTPEYLHLPIATGTDGNKLGKRHQADPVAGNDRVLSLRAALEFLGQPAPPSGLDLEGIWGWAVAHWDTGLIPRDRHIVTGKDTGGS